MTSEYLPTAKLDLLRQRAALLRRVRAFFEARGFLEVETPLLSHDTVVDRHLDPFTTRHEPNPTRTGQGSTLYLQTSPEFGMKRLLAAGAGPIYQITRSFRNGERGPLHNPEFTMLEWYRPGDDYPQGMQLLADLAREVSGAETVETLTYEQVFRAHYQLAPHTATVAELQAAAQLAGLHAPASLGNDRDGWLDFLLTERIQPSLGQAAPVILCDYPASQAALAQTRFDPKLGCAVAERFELYWRGIELANGYHELLDPVVLRARNTSNNALRASDGKSKLPEESRLLAAMEAGLPACSGCALGLDRLLMILTGAKTIDEVLAFPLERA
jgi:elongation factor P--(R)-beta-lysine ligase